MDFTGIDLGSSPDWYHYPVGGVPCQAKRQLRAVRLCLLPSHRMDTHSVGRQICFQVIGTDGSRPFDCWWHRLQHRCRLLPLETYTLRPCCMAPVRHRWQCLPFLFHIVLCSSRGTLNKIIPLLANSRH